MSISTHSDLDVLALFCDKRRAGNTFGEVPGPSNPTVQESNVRLNLSATGAPRVQDAPVSFGLAAAAALVALAARIATSPSHHKRLLCALYEAGAIGGTALEVLLIQHELEAA